MATALDPALNPDVFGMQPRLPTAAPKPATPMAAAEERLAGTEEKLGTALKQQAEFAGAQAEQERKQVAAKAKGEAEILGKQAEELRAAEEPIRVAEEEKMKARFAPTRETAMEMAGLYSLIGVLGFAIGRGGKQSSLQAMSAMNGMMEGYRQGSTDRFNQEKKLFDSHLKSLSDNISTLTSRLQRVVQLSTVDKLKAEQELTVALAESGADFVKQNINKFGLPATIQYLKQVQSAAQRAVDKERDFERKAEQKAAEQQKAFEQKKELAQLAASLKQPKESEEEKAVAKMGGAGIQSQIYRTTGKVVKDRRDAEAIGNTVSAINEINSLKERLKDPEIVTGLQAVPQPFFQKLRSLVGQNVNESEVRNFVDSELTGNDKTTLFIKDAILAGFKIEQGLTGTRVPVFTQRVVGPILDPRSYTPQAYDKLLSSRKEELLDRAWDRGIDEDDIEKMRRPSKAAAPVAPRYQVGQVIEKGGKKYKITSLANPNDPDVEEVK